MCARKGIKLQMASKKAVAAAAAATATTAVIMVLFCYLYAKIRQECDCDRAGRPINRAEWTPKNCASARTRAAKNFWAHHNSPWSFYSFKNNLNIKEEEDEKTLSKETQKHILTLITRTCLFSLSFLLFRFFFGVHYWYCHLCTFYPLDCSVSFVFFYCFAIYIYFVNWINICRVI